jgi:hypothetical protein
LKGENLRRNNIEENVHNEAQVKELAEKKGGKRLRPLDFEILPRLGSKGAISGGSTTVVKSVGGRDLDHWFLHPGITRASI